MRILGLVIWLLGRGEAMEREEHEGGVELHVSRVPCGLTAGRVWPGAFQSGGARCCRMHTAERCVRPEGVPWIVEGVPWIVRRMGGCSHRARHCATRGATRAKAARIGFERSPISKQADFRPAPGESSGIARRGAGWNRVNVPRATWRAP